MKRLKSLKERCCSRCGAVIAVGTCYYRMYPSKDPLIYSRFKTCCIACHRELASQLLVQEQLEILDREVREFLSNTRESLDGLLDGALIKIKNLDLKAYFEETPAIQQLVLGYWHSLWKARKHLMRMIQNRWKRMRAPVNHLTKLLRLHEELARICQAHPSFRRRALDEIQQRLAHQHSRVGFIRRDLREQEHFLRIFNDRNDKVKALEVILQNLKEKYQRPLERSLLLALQSIKFSIANTENQDFKTKARQLLQVVSYLEKIDHEWDTVETLTDFSETERQEVAERMRNGLLDLEEMLSPLIDLLKSQRDHFDQEAAALIHDIATLLGFGQKYQQELKTIQIDMLSEIIHEATKYHELDQLEQRFPILSDPSCPSDVKTALESKRNQLFLQEIRTTAEKLLKTLETTVRDEEWWPVRVERELLECVSNLPPDEQLEIAQKMVALFQEFSENIQKTAESFMESYPEAFQEPQLVPITLRDETGWGSLLAFDLTKNKWIPSWDHAWSLSFPRAHHSSQSRDQDTKKTKKRAPWTLTGQMPIGTLVMISYPPQARNRLKSVLQPEITPNSNDGQVTPDNHSNSAKFVSAENYTDAKPRRIRRYFIVSHLTRGQDNHLREIHPRPREILKLISFMRGELTSELLRSKAMRHAKKFAPSEFAQFFKSLRQHGNIVNGIQMIEEATLHSNDDAMVSIPSLGMMLHAVLSGTNRQAFQQQYLIISRLIREKDMKTLDKISQMIKSPHIKVLLQSYKQIRSLSADELNRHAAKNKVVFVTEEKKVIKCTVCFETISEGPELPKCRDCNIPTCEDCARLLMEEASPCPGYLLTGNLHLFSLL